MIKYRDIILKENGEFVYIFGYGDLKEYLNKINEDDIEFLRFLKEQESFDPYFIDDCLNIINEGKKKFLKKGVQIGVNKIRNLAKDTRHKIGKMQTRFE